MALYCHACGLSKFRASHFRFQLSDLWRLLLLRLPVRCMICGERSYASISQIHKLRHLRHRENCGTT
jgi:hypothetical protein